MIQLEVDGVLLPLAPDAKLSVNANSDFLNLEYLEGTHTYAFQVPYSAASRRLFQYAHLGQTPPEALPFGQSLPARVLLRHVPLLAGQLRMLRTTAAGYECTLLANTSALADKRDTSLRELVDVTMTTQQAYELLPEVRVRTDATKADSLFTWQVCRLPWLLQQLAQALGYTLDMQVHFSPQHLATLVMRAHIAPDIAGVRVTGPDVKLRDLLTSLQRLFCWTFYLDQRAGVLYVRHLPTLLQQSPDTDQQLTERAAPSVQVEDVRLGGFAFELPAKSAIAKEQNTELPATWAEVATWADLPTAPETGDVALVRDLATFYVWEGNWRLYAFGSIALQTGTAEKACKPQLAAIWMVRRPELVATEGEAKVWGVHLNIEDGRRLRIEISYEYEQVTDQYLTECWGVAGQPVQLQVPDLSINVSGRVDSFEIFRSAGVVYARLYTDIDVDHTEGLAAFAADSAAQLNTKKHVAGRWVYAPEWTEATDEWLATLAHGPVHDYRATSGLQEYYLTAQPLTAAPTPAPIAGQDYPMALCYPGAYGLLARCWGNVPAWALGMRLQRYALRLRLRDVWAYEPVPARIANVRLMPRALKYDITAQGIENAELEAWIL